MPFSHALASPSPPPIFPSPTFPSLSLSLSHSPSCSDPPCYRGNGENLRGLLRQLRAVDGAGCDPQADEFYGRECHEWKIVRDPHHTCTPITHSLTSYIHPTPT